MAQVHDKIRAVMEDRGDNISQAAARCGLKYSTFHSAMKHDREIGFTTLESICRGYGISLAYFSPETPIVGIVQVVKDNPLHEKAAEILDRALKVATRNHLYDGDKISLEGFLNWWYSNSGRLEGFDKIADRVDLFTPPKDGDKTIQPVKIGMESLATKRFFLERTSHLKQTLDGFSEATNAALISAHLEALERGEPVITHPSLNEKLRDGSRFVRQYRRVMAPVYLPDGKPMLVNFSQDIL